VGTVTEVSAYGMESAKKMECWKEWSWLNWKFGENRELEGSDLIKRNDWKRDGQESCNW